MNSEIHHALAHDRIDELHRAGARERRANDARAAAGSDRPLTIRRSRHTDLEAIGRLAQLDSQWPPAAPLLVAEIGDEIVAALSLETEVVVADPFKRTAEVVALLCLRAEQLTLPRRRVRSVLRRFAFRRAVPNWQRSSSLRPG